VVVRPLVRAKLRAVARLAWPLPMPSVLRYNHWLAANATDGAESTGRATRTPFSHCTPAGRLMLMVVALTTATVGASKPYSMPYAGSAANDATIDA
jgi:hypothetical protein